MTHETNDETETEVEWNSINDVPDNAKILQNGYVIGDSGETLGRVDPEAMNPDPVLMGDEQ